MQYSVNHDEKTKQFIIQLDPNDEAVIANLTYQFENHIVSGTETKIVFTPWKLPRHGNLTFHMLF